jgi:CP family cyanate transporter-like MFS transporter
LTILAVPPVIAQIQAELGLSAAAVGLLSSLPAAMFALAALPGSLLVSALGTRRTLIIGLALVAGGSAARGLGDTPWALFAATAAMGAGVAMMQPAMPALVRQWVPRRIGLATAVYTNGLLAGEVFPVVLTAPVVLALVGGSWRGSLVVWSIPVLGVAGFLALFAPSTPLPSGFAIRARPNWKSGLVWRIALLFGCVNGLYFATNAFIPGYFVARGETAWTSAALSALNFGQIPASLLLLMFAPAVERRAWPFWGAGVMALAGLAGLAVLDGPGATVGAALVGFSCATCLILGLTLPALLCPPAEVAVTAAAVFTVSYASAVLTGVLCGLAWDVTGIPASLFLALGTCAVLLCGAPLLMVRQGELR